MANDRMINAHSRFVRFDKRIVFIIAVSGTDCSAKFPLTGLLSRCVSRNTMSTLGAWEDPIRFHHFDVIIRHSTYVTVVLANCLTVGFMVYAKDQYVRLRMMTSKW